MNLTVFDPRTGKHTTITVPPKTATRSPELPPRSPVERQNSPDQPACRMGMCSPNGSTQTK
jgi:hypothetical protein